MCLLGFNVLPSPSNLKHWEVDKEPSCPLRGKQLCNIAHILGACNISQQQGHFTFKHESLLNALLSALTIFIISNHTNRNKIHFIKAGHQPPKHESNPTGILHLTTDWILISEVDNNYVFPFEIAVTELSKTLFQNTYTHCFT